MFPKNYIYIYIEYNNYYYYIYMLYNYILPTGEKNKMNFFD